MEEDLSVCRCSSGRAAGALRQALIGIFFAESIGDWHVDNAVEQLSKLPGERIAHVLSLVRLVSTTVSDLLAFTFMENVADASRVLDDAKLDEWVRGAMAIYESGGLYAARSYLGDVAGTTAPLSSSDRACDTAQTWVHLHLLLAGLTGRDPS